MKPHLHSMCQPGRPLPQGLSQDGSPSLALFHRAKSPGLRLLELTATLSPALLSSYHTKDDYLFIQE